MPIRSAVQTVSGPLSVSSPIVTYIRNRNVPFGRVSMRVNLSVQACKQTVADCLRSRLDENFLVVY